MYNASKLLPQYLILKRNMQLHLCISFLLVKHVSSIVATLAWPSVGVKPNTWKSWGLGVLRDSRMFRARQQGAKHLALQCSWSHWKKVLKRKYRKCSRILDLDICSSSYGQKKGRESNWQFDSRPLKVGNRPSPEARFGSAIRRWKDLDKGYNIGLDLVAIRGQGEEL